MSGSNQNGNNHTVHFGVYDADLRTQELRKHGTRVKLPRQSFQVLQMLLQRSGELVTREELQQALWSSDTFVDFDHGLNNAVKRIRAVLGDSAESPHWIETLPRLGYRFIGTIQAPSNGHTSAEGVHAGNGSVPGASTPSTAAPPIVPSPIIGVPSRGQTKWWLLAAFAVVVAVLGIGLYHRMQRTTSEANNLRIIPFTSYPGFEFSPSFSPDGNQIAFSWTGGESIGTFDLYVKVVGTDSPVRFTNNPAAALIPSWSPDGRFIAFSRFKINSPSDTGIFLIPASGGAERKLAEVRFAKHVFSGGLAWTPDSQSLIFPVPAETEFGSRLVLLNVQTHEQRNLPSPDTRCVGVGFAQFSPDGRALASACMVDFGLGALFVQAWPNGNPHKILDVKGDLEGLTWSQDGKSLIYSLGTDLWRLPAHGGQPEQLWFAQGAYHPTVARVGSRLAFTRVEKAVDLWRVSIQTGSAPAVPPFRLAPSELSQQGPRYSPDGKQIAFESTRSGTQEVWVCDADGSHLLQITSFGGPLTGTPNWSPDGKRIVLDSRASGRPELYIVDAQGGKPRLLPTGPEGGSVPFWSHDGEWIYFASEVGGVAQLFKIRPSGGNPIQLTSKGGFVSKESVDGKRLYYSRVLSNTELWSVSTDGGDEQLVPGVPRFNWPAWDLGKNGIYYFDSVQAPNSGGTTVSFYDFRTGQSRKATQLLGMPAPFGMGLSVSPDETNLLYSSVGRSTADIELVEGFR
jgi:Tol biopolymer transport system component/DNA-binding winged helix-turn-helix (wHTH) protein